MRAIVFDTEATGIDDPEIIEAAWISYGINEEYQHIEFNQRYKPSKPISWGALATHHIHESELQDEPPSSEFKLPEGIEYLIGHNIDFDWKAAGEPDIKRICTLAISRKLFPEMDSHSQTAMLYRFWGAEAKKLSKDAHSALADVINCRLVLNILIIHMQEHKNLEVKDLDHLWRISEAARIPDVISFGKHKGTHIKELPSDYVRWLLKQNDLDPYLKKALLNG